MRYFSLIRCARFKILFCRYIVWGVCVYITHGVTVRAPGCVCVLCQKPFALRTLFNTNANARERACIWLKMCARSVCVSAWVPACLCSLTSLINQTGILVCVFSCKYTIQNDLIPKPVYGACCSACELVTARYCFSPFAIAISVKCLLSPMVCSLHYFV